jgi:hypothetical protein
MKTFHTSLLLAAFACSVASQTTIPPGMAYVPNTLLNYDYWRDRDQNIRISDHYAARYVESNLQYRYYLDYLKAWGLEKHWQFAQPDPSIWDMPNLTLNEQAYLKENFWTAKEFQHYPVVGLDYEQVRAYLHWKTCMLNLAAYEAAGGTEDYVYNWKDSTTVRNAEGYPKLFSIKEYLFRTTDSTRIYEPIAPIRLPTAQELFTELPLPKKTKKGTAKPDKKLLAWLKSQPKFAFLTYEPPKTNTRPTDLQQALEALGIRPVIASDLDKLKKRKDFVNLPLLCMEQRLPKHLYTEGFIYACDEEDLKRKQSDPNFNPKNLQVIVFDPKKAGTIAWVSNKGKLVTMSISTIGERPLCGFRGMMTKRG